MKRSNEQSVKLLEELFDEITHNYGISIAQGLHDEYTEYIIERLYYCMYEEEEE